MQEPRVLWVSHDLRASHLCGRFLLLGDEALTVGGDLRGNDEHFLPFIPHSLGVASIEVIHVAETEKKTTGLMRQSLSGFSTRKLRLYSESTAVASGGVSGWSTG